MISRSFEASYQERASATSQLGATSSGGDIGNTETAQLTLKTTASDSVVAPGTRFALVVDVTPKPRMHVYSPDQTTYIPVALEIAANDAVKVHAPRFPPSEEYLFKPLNERQRVYTRPFRIAQELTVALTPAVRERARAAGATITINGTLRYQACDDKVCYPPAMIPFVVDGRPRALVAVVQFQRASPLSPDAWIPARPWCGSPHGDRGAVGRAERGRRA